MPAKKTVKTMLKLTFPQKLIRQPVIYTVARKFNLVPNVRRARITEKVGEVVLELNGEAVNLNRAVKYLVKNGVIIEPVIGDIIE